MNKNGKLDPADVKAIADLIIRKGFCVVIKGLKNVNIF